MGALKDHAVTNLDVEEHTVSHLLAAHLPKEDLYECPHFQWHLGHTSGMCLDALRDQCLLQQCEAVLSNYHHSQHQHASRSFGAEVAHMLERKGKGRIALLSLPTILQVAILGPGLQKRHREPYLICVHGANRLVGDPHRVVLAWPLVGQSYRLRSAAIVKIYGFVCGGTHTLATFTCNIYCPDARGITQTGSCMHGKVDVQISFLLTITVRCLQHLGPVTRPVS
eukprot:scaffold121633_cov21-Tisochrysis_lutea.AAC.1